MVGSLLCSVRTYTTIKYVLISFFSCAALCCAILFLGKQSNAFSYTFSLNDLEWARSSAVPKSNVPKIYHMKDTANEQLASFSKQITQNTHSFLPFKVLSFFLMMSASDYRVFFPFFCLLIMNTDPNQMKRESCAEVLITISIPSFRLYKTIARWPKYFSPLWKVNDSSKYKIRYKNRFWMDEPCKDLDFFLQKLLRLPQYQNFPSDVKEDFPQTTFTLSIC